MCYYIYCKCTWVISLKDKKVTTITNPFQNILDVSNGKPSKVWVEKDSEFYNRSMKPFLHSEGKSVFSERFIRAEKNNIYQCMPSVSQKCLYE